MRTPLILLLAALLVALPAAAQDATEEPLMGSDFVFGMVLVGPRDDEGWSQAHYEGGQFVEETIGATMLLAEDYGSLLAGLQQEAAQNNRNPDNIEPPMNDIVADMVLDGAQLIFMTSAEFVNDTNRLALEHPEVTFVQIAGDAVLTGTAPANVGNIMGQMEWGKFAVGCAAALTTETGQVGYLGPLIDSETRRLAASAYLGARHCYQQYRGDDAPPLVFRVEWVGFWFEIPGVTRNPRRLVFSLYNNDFDVVLSGIDTPVAVEIAREFRNNGDVVYASAYENTGPCDDRPDVCIGTAFFNWGPSYADTAERVIAGTWEPEWDWLAPNWDAFDEVAETPVGFVTGGAFPEEFEDELTEFLTEMEDYTRNPFVPVSFPLWQGLLRLQDGTLLADDEELVNLLDVWYLTQLLEGMEGESFQFQLEDD
ncbi:MAG: BMP family ABC transporter substrate-binding protein [Chloroflexota bacterium]